MNTRLNFYKQSPDLVKKLLDLSQASKTGSLGNTVLDLVNIRASQLNGCAFCLDMHSKEAKMHGERELRVYHIPVWRESPLFTPFEKAVLEWTEVVTKLDGHGIPDEVYDRVRGQLSETQISELTFAIGIINAWNRLSVSFRSVPGSFDEMLGLTKAGLK